MDIEKMDADIEQIDISKFEWKQSEYYSDKKFLARTFAEDILQYSGKYFLSVLETDEILYYDKGMYKEFGEKLLQDIITRIFGNNTRFTMINEVMMHIRSMTRTPLKELNKNPTLVPLKNGVCDIQENALRDHNPKYKFTYQLPVKYNQESNCPTFTKFLREIVTPSDAIILQEMFGYCLLGTHKYHRCFMLKGEGSNGKSTLLNCLVRILGLKNTCGVSIQDLIYNRFALARIHGKLANIVQDLPSTKLQSLGVFKAITGEDDVEAEIKGIQKSIRFKSTAKQIFATNSLPITEDVSYAFFRRWVIIDFPNTFSEQDADPELNNKLSTEEELSGILWWSISGAKRLLDNGGFSKSDVTKEVMETWIRATDPIRCFILDELEEDSSFTCENNKNDLYNEYVIFCDSKGHPALDYSHFFKEFKRKISWRIRENRPRKRGGSISSGDSRTRVLLGFKIVRFKYPVQLVQPLNLFRNGKNDNAIYVVKKSLDRLDQAPQEKKAPKTTKTLPETIVFNNYMEEMWLTLETQKGKQLTLEDIYSITIIEGSIDKKKVDEWLKKQLESGSLFECKPGIYQRL